MCTDKSLWHSNSIQLFKLYSSSFFNAYPSSQANFLSAQAEPIWACAQAILLQKASPHLKLHFSSTREILPILQDSTQPPKHTLNYYNANNPK